MSNGILGRKEAMKKLMLKTITLVMTLLISVAGLNGIAMADYTPLNTAEVGAGANIAEDYLPGLLLDNFNDSGSLNLWYGQTATFGTDGSCTGHSMRDGDVELGNTGYSLRLDYDVSTPGSYAGYYTNLDGADLSSYNYLSIWVRGQGSGQYFKIEIHHENFDAGQAAGYNDNYSAQVYVTDYLDGGVNPDWQKVVIPLDAFTNIHDWTNMGEIVIVFEEAQSTANGSPTIGTIYVDNISFGQQFLGFVRLDHYGDIEARNALGGLTAYVPSDGSRGSAGFVAAPKHVTANALQFNFNGMSAATDRYFSTYSIFGGGEDGSTESTHDFSAYDQLSYWIKGDIGDEYGIRAELASPGRACYRYMLDAVTVNWTRHTIPLGEFMTSDTGGTPSGDPVDPAQLIKSAFVYNYWLHSFGGVDTGTVYIDDVQFEVSGHTPDTTVPTQPSTPVLLPGTGMVTVTVTADSRAQDPSMEHVRFEYYHTGWRTIDYDYNTDDSTYSATWYTGRLNPETTYPVRAVAVDSVYNIAESGETDFVKP